jgi:hypothetical protein
MGTEAFGRENGSGEIRGKYMAEFDVLGGEISPQTRDLEGAVICQGRVFDPGSVGVSDCRIIRRGTYNL